MTVRRVLPTAPAERLWEVLTDVERIAPCLPGAQLTEVEGEARAKDFSISSDGTVSDVSDPPTFDNRYEADAREAAKLRRG